MKNMLNINNGMNDIEKAEFIRLRKIHSEMFLDGLEFARSKVVDGIPFDKDTFEQQKIRVANEVCDLAYIRVGSYGSTKKVRVALTNYVQSLAVEFI